MTALLRIATDALKQMGRYQVPSSIYGNSDPTAVRLLALANLTGRALADLNWQALLNTKTFSTANGTAAYNVPDDFDRFANLTMWNRTNHISLTGPMSPAQWENLQSAQIATASPFYQYWRMSGGQISIYPTPTSVQTIAFDYYSNQWITGKTEFTADTDVPLLDAGLMTLGIRWQFLAAMGDAFDTEFALFNKRLEYLQGADGGKNAIRFMLRPVQTGDNLPTINFGT